MIIEQKVNVLNSESLEFIKQLLVFDFYDSNLGPARPSGFAH